MASHDLFPYFSDSDELIAHHRFVGGQTSPEILKIWICNIEKNETLGFFEKSKLDQTHLCILRHRRKFLLEISQMAEDGKSKLLDLCFTLLKSPLSDWLKLQTISISNLKSNMQFLRNEYLKIFEDILRRRKYSFDSNLWSNI